VNCQVTRFRSAGQLMNIVHLLMLCRWSTHQPRLVFILTPISRNISCHCIVSLNDLQFCHIGSFFVVTRTYGYTSHGHFGGHLVDLSLLAGELSKECRKILEIVESTFYKPDVVTRSHSQPSMLEHGRQFCVFLNNKNKLKTLISTRWERWVSLLHTSVLKVLFWFHYDHELWPFHLNIRIIAVPRCTVAKSLVRIRPVLLKILC